MAAGEGSPVGRPNIVLFVVDDLGWRDLSCYGSEVYETPEIDRLAREGVRFTQAYAAYPRCVPSRYAIMTGQNPARGGVPARGERLPAEARTIAEALRDAGYSTFYAGKWHLMGAEDEAPANQGFEVTVGAGHPGATSSHLAPYNESRSRFHQGEGRIPDLEDAPKDEYLADRLTDETLAFIRRHHSDHAERPFFAVLSHYAVHTPIEGKPAKVSRYADKIAAHTFDGAPYLEQDGETKRWQDNAAYAAMVESVDESLGRLRAALRELGIEDNTAIIVTSDHGGLSNRGAGNNRELATSNLPLRAGKGHCYEGGIRIPLIVYWPEVTKAGLESDFVSVGMDHFPTLLELVGAPLEPQHHVDGVSYAAALRGDTAPRGVPVFWHSPKARPKNTGDENCTAIREGSFKLLDFYDAGRVELYDLSNDVGERRDLAQQEPARVEKLLAELRRWRLSVGAEKNNGP